MPNRLSAGSGRGALPITANHDAFMSVASSRLPSMLMGAALRCRPAYARSWRSRRVGAAATSDAISADTAAAGSPAPSADEYREDGSTSGGEKAPAAATRAGGEGWVATATLTLPPFFCSSASTPTITSCPEGSLLCGRQCMHGNGLPPLKLPPTELRAGCEGAPPTVACSTALPAVLFATSSVITACGSSSCA